MPNRESPSNDTSSQVRLRVRYSKGDRLAYLGHLEVLNTVNRSIRRSCLPFAVGNGFARRIRLQFSQALPVGASSDGEYYDVMLTERVDAARALEMLAGATPSALAPDAATYVPRSLDALEAWLTRSEWEVALPLAGFDPVALEHAIASLRDRGELHYLRGDKPKSIDLSLALVDWEFAQVSQDELLVRLDTRSSNEGALRPAILLSAAFATEEMGSLEAPIPRVCRKRQWHETEDGHLVEPLSPGLQNLSRG